MLSRLMMVEDDERKPPKMRCDYCRKRTRRYLCGPRPISETEWELGVMCDGCRKKPKEAP